MMLVSLAFAAALGGPEALPEFALRPQDRRADCPAWLAQAIVAEDSRALDSGFCIWTDTGAGSQTHYVDQLKQAGWSHAGGAANVMSFRKGGACLAMAGFPVGQPGSEAIGSDRDLRQPEPAAQAAVFLILLDETGACAPGGDH